MKNKCDTDTQNAQVPFSVMLPVVIAGEQLNCLTPLFTYSVC